MYKLLPFALAAYAAVATPQDEATTTSTQIGDTFPAEPSVIFTTIADSFPEAPEVTSIIIADPSSAFGDPSVSSSVIADPSTAFGDPSVTSSIIADPSTAFDDPVITPSSIPYPPPPHGWPINTPGRPGGWTTSTVTADPTPVPEGPGGEEGSPTNPEDPQFTGGAATLDVPVYVVAGILAGAAIL
ncbi:hypothetical protein BJY04DRAFT_219982 [Aspergillus karnatakaensis]|uniref:uncharacterized protein n=1 Tax=Aspergillus karnatakaensis TaxID=1810916 RepID=UPI003CCD525D